MNPDPGIRPSFRVIAMYESFFQLTKTPFSLVSDPECIHLTAQYESVIRALVFAVLERKGYVVLTGEAGLGKSTALRALSELLVEWNVNSSVILTPTLTASEFLEMVMLNFGFKAIPTSKALRLKLLEDFLIKSDDAGRVSVLVVDEAHQLSEEALEEIRLLGNFESTNRKLLQIVMAGQSEFNDRLNLPHMWHLKQRIAIRLALSRLNNDSVGEYIQYRWSEAGGTGPLPFTGAALDVIAVWSCGIPRLINTICDNALLIAFSETTRSVDVEIIREACIDLGLATPEVMPRQRAVEPAPLRPQIEPALLPLANPQTPLPGGAEPRPTFLNRWRRRPHQAASSQSSIFSLNEPV
jgi:general secretion pathway protein A